MMVRRSAMEKVGMMDERYFLYFEDVDWCRRFWQNGYEIYYLGQSAELVHYHQRLSAENPGLTGLFSYPTRVHILSGIKYFTKFFHSQKPTNAITFEKRHG
jgi:GT2 family glycosyltransferase